MPRKKTASKNQILNGVIYARYSSHNQKEQSIEQQVEECRLFADGQSIKIMHVYADKAVSGKTDRRTQFQRMMRDADKGLFDVVIAYKSNRIARNMLNALQTEARLADSGVDVLYAKEEFGNTASGRFALRTMMNVNQFYSENMAEDIRRGMKDNAEDCKVNGSLPYGYRRGEDGKYAIDEARAAVVREIFDSVLRGVPNIEICDSLNARGITTKTGGLWTRTSFSRILVNERYIGVYEHSGIRVEGGVPAIIGKEVFYEVQNRIRTKTNAVGAARHGRADYLLTGKLFCGECGSRMIGISGTARDGNLRYYYTCDGKHKDKSCHKQNVPRDYLENMVIEMTNECLSESGMVDYLVAGYELLQKQIREESDLPLMQSDLDAKRKALANIMKAIEAGIFNDTTSVRMQELEYDIKELEREIELQQLYDSKAPKPDEIRFYLSELSSGAVNNSSYKRDIINTLVKAVRLWDDRIEIDYNFTAGGPETVRRSGSYNAHIAPPRRSKVRFAPALFFCFIKMGWRAVTGLSAYLFCVIIIYKNAPAHTGRDGCSKP